MSQSPMANKYDLEERTAKFGENIVKLCHDLPKNEVTRPIIHQLVKCGTSIGANYCEADNAESKKDFKHKIGICKKGARETMYFLRICSIALETEADSKTRSCFLRRYPARTVRWPGSSSTINIVGWSFFIGSFEWMIVCTGEYTAFSGLPQSPEVDFRFIAVFSKLGKFIQLY